VINLKEKYEIIELKTKGKSNREVARLTKTNRKTVARYWNEHQEQLKRLDSAEPREPQEIIISSPTYNSSSRKDRKYSAEIDSAIDEILSSEAKKCEELGISHKQRLSNVQIHELIVERGFDIGLTTVSVHIAKKRGTVKEAFIRQEYDFAQRLEYDFGEVNLIIGGEHKRYYLAAFGSPASSFRWGYLYDNQSKDVFLDSHVHFFEMCGGVWRECVYDNMRNVVKRFIGKNEKELNDDLIKMGLYYGFEINVTNCFSPNEKGFVESAVKYIRNKVFATHWEFDSIEEAHAHLEKRLIELNATSKIEEEKHHLLPGRPPLEIARISEAVVDKYSFIRVANNFYSVPDYLVGKTLTVKLYPSEVVIYSEMVKICTHKRSKGSSEYVVDIFHYLDTLLKKPGAVKNSVALKSHAALKKVFDEHYSSRPREFVLLLKENTSLPADELVQVIKTATGAGSTASNRPTDKIAENIFKNTQRQLVELSQLVTKGGERVAS